MMDYNEKIQILRACSSKRGKRCSSCPAFGQGNHNCMRNAMKDAATALSELQDENNKLRAELEQVKRERDAVLNAFRGFIQSGHLCEYCAETLKDNPACSACKKWSKFQWRGVGEDT